MSNKNYVPVDFSQDILAKGGKVIWSRDSRIGTTGGSKKNVLPGDICLYSGHVNIALEKSKDGKSIKCVGGNQHGKAPNGSWSTNEVTVGMRSDQIWVIRPKYKDTAINGLQVTGDTYTTEEEGATGKGTLEVHPEQLYSSANYHYLDESFETVETEEEKRSREAVNKMITAAQGYTAAPRDTSSNVGIISGGAKSEAKKLATKVNGAASGTPLNTAIFPVEAPFAEVTIGGKTFGAGWRDGAPNYMNSVTIKRTNASMAEYTLNLSHQVSPGRNPN